MKKIYCENCRYKKEAMGEYTCTTYCSNMNTTKEITYSDGIIKPKWRRKEVQNCVIINFNNDCKYFIEKQPHKGILSLLYGD